MKEIRILALIPARGGSKGIPGKNIRLLAGRPLIAHTIEAALASDQITDVVVSTDSREIAQTAKAYGAWVPFLRPQALASDTAKTMDAVMYTIDQLRDMGKEYAYIVLLQPTSPLRTTEDIDGAVRLAVDKGQDVVGISEVSDSPILMRTCAEDGTLTSLLGQNSTVRRQDMPVYYRVNGSVYVNGVQNLTKDTSLNDNPIGYILPKERSVDIDEMADFAVAEYYLKKRNRI